MSSTYRDEDRIMSFAKWCEFNGFSRTTGWRICKAGDGPEFVQLSAGRVGITYRANREWQQSRIIKPEIAASNRDNAA